MPFTPTQTGTNPPNVDAVFSRNKLIRWWQQPTGSVFGDPGEYGVDYAMPFNSPVGALTSGKVVFVGQTNPGTSVGYVVSVLHDDGSLIHYHHLGSVPADVKVGQTVVPGQIIGYSSGCAAGSSAGHCIGDQYSWSGSPGSGVGFPHIEVRYTPSYNPNNTNPAWNQNWIDPRSFFAKAAGQKDYTGQYNYGPNATNPPTSGGCAPWDIGCIWNTIHGGLVGFGVHIGLFVLALFLIALGGFLLLKPQMEKASQAIPKVLPL